MISSQKFLTPIKRDGEKCPYFFGIWMAVDRKGSHHFLVRKLILLGHLNSAVKNKCPAVGFAAQTYKNTTSHPRNSQSIMPNGSHYITYVIVRGHLNCAFVITAAVNYTVSQKKFPPLNSL